MVHSATITTDNDDGEPWPTAKDVAAHGGDMAASLRNGTGGATRGAAAAGSESSSSAAEMIEVLLPEGEHELEYPNSECASDAASDEFVEWMAQRTQCEQGGATPPPGIMAARSKAYRTAARGKVPEGPTEAFRPRPAAASRCRGGSAVAVTSVAAAEEARSAAALAANDVRR